MDNEGTERKLAAIFCADVEGYSRLMGVNEVTTLRALTACRSVTDECIGRWHGRIVNTAGDSVLAEFASAVDAVQCAVEIQQTLGDSEEDRPASDRIQFRIGINVGDVLARDGDLFGDGVNVAARIQSLASPGGICVSRNVRDHVRDKISLRFDDLGEHVVKNIQRPVRIYAVHLDDRRIAATSLLELPDKPSVAVLPFDNMSDDPSQEYFADGVVEEITAALCRVRSLFVIARNSTFTYKARPMRAQQIGVELGVRYLIEGSVRKAGDRVRITAQLIDTSTGNHIWANRYDGALSDIFDLQDSITESVVGAIQPSILTAEIERARRKRPESLVAYDYVLRALPSVWSLDKVENEAARALLDQAIAIEPTYPLALSLAAWCHAQCAVYNWTDTPAEAREEALRLAQRAAAISRDDPMVLAILGAAHAVARDYDIAAMHLERALALDPNSAWGWNRSGWLNSYLDRPQLAIEQFERAIRLSPFDPMGFNCLVGIGGAHFIAGRYDQAVAWIQKGINQQPKAIWAFRQLVPALFYAGREAEARRALGVLMQGYPGLTISKVRDAMVYTPATMDRIVDGLRAVGLPD